MTGYYRTVWQVKPFNSDKKKPGAFSQMTVAIFRNRKCTSMSVDSIRAIVHLVQHSARNTSFLKSLIKIYVIDKKLASPKQSAEDDSNPAGVCVKCFD